MSNSKKMSDMTIEELQTFGYELYVEREKLTFQESKIESTKKMINLELQKVEEKLADKGYKGPSKGDKKQND